MDATDIRLLRTMGVIPFLYGARGPDALKPSRLARRLNVSLKTAKGRLARLETQGVVAAYQIYPNLRHLGLQWHSFFFRAPKEVKDAVAKDLDNVEGVVTVMDFFGPDLCVDLHFRDEAERDRRLRLLSSLLDGSEALVWYENRMPPVDGSLTSLDWRIIQALRMRARAPVEDIARKLNVTGRTVRRRLHGMVKAGAIDVVPVVDPTKMQNTFPFAVVFTLEQSEAQATVRRIEKEFDASYLSAWVPPSSELGHFALLVCARRTGKFQEIRDRAASLPGVRHAEAFIPADMRDFPEWIDEEIARRARAEATEGATARP